MNSKDNPTRICSAYALPYNDGMRRSGGNRKRGARNQTGSPDRARPRDASSPFGQPGSGGRSETLPATTGGYGRELRELLSGIGTPKPAPLKPDPFQLQALTSLEFWYTTPLKALTNSKYAEFSEEFGPERVGILTGDRKENSNAPLIVGTTEIFRNQLFDSLRGGDEVSADLVVFDEAHYLADEERGHVWEEAIILTPPRIRMLLLSATIGNADEFAAWIAEVRGVHCGVVTRPGARPVPLRAAFLMPDKRLLPLLNQHGRLNSEIARLSEQVQRERGAGRGGRRRW